MFGQLTMVVLEENGRSKRKKREGTAGEGEGEGNEGGKRERGGWGRVSVFLF